MKKSRNLDMDLYSFDKDYFKKIAFFKSKYYYSFNNNVLLDRSDVKKIYKLNKSLNENASNSMDEYGFSFGQENHSLKPFDVLQIENQLKLINIGSEITALDWCIDDPNDAASKSVQYFAFACKNVNLFNIPLYILEESVANGVVYNGNIIYIGKLTNLNSKDSKLEIFGIFDKNIGTINCLKWGVLNSSDKKNSIGYLLAASSNGDGYVYMVDDVLTKSSDSLEEHNKLFSINAINCYEPDFKITLKSSSTHECITGDWNQYNEANQVCMGYSDGSANMYKIGDNRCFKDTFYPVKKLQKSSNAVEIIKWSKVGNTVQQIYGGLTQENQKKNLSMMTIK